MILQYSIRNNKSGQINFTLIAPAPFGPHSISKLTLSCCWISCKQLFTCTKRLSPDCRSLINPYPLASLRKVTFPFLMRSSGSTGFCSGTPITISSALITFLLAGSGGTEVMIPFSSTYAIILSRSPAFAVSFLCFFLSSFSFFAFCFCFSRSFLFHVSRDLPIMNSFDFKFFDQSCNIR